MRKRKLETQFLRAGGGMLLAMLLAVSTASAEEFKYKGLDIRWDNTIKYSTSFRVQNPDPNLLVDRNFDDSAYDFPSQGNFFSNRADILSEFDVQFGEKKNFAIRVSGAGWYDSIYATSNSNVGGISNNFSVPRNQFTAASKGYLARRFELLDAFVFLRKPLGGQKEFDVRVGRQTVLWGTALFFGSNGIAFNQSPLDANKGAMSPNSQAKELFMPTGQLWMSFKAGKTYSFEGFYQFEQRKNVLPAAGSYFSPFDAPDIGGERLMASDFTALFRGKDRTPANSGTFGIAFNKQFHRPNWETGYYFYQANDRNSLLVSIPGVAPCPVCPGGIFVFNPGVVNLARGQIGQFIYAYPEKIKVAGASFSANLPGSTGASYAGEVSYRWNMPLNSLPLLQVTPVATWDLNKHPLWAVGNTFHANFNIMQGLSRNKVWHSALLLAEVGYNHLMKITRNPAMFDVVNHQTDAIAFSATFVPSWYQVIPRWDVDLPFGMTYSPKSRGAAADLGLGVDRGGNFSPGINLTYAKNWKGSLKYNHYWGKDSLLVTGPNSGGGSGLQFFRGKDFVSITLQRTF